MDHPRDGIRFESCGATRKFSPNDSVYIKEVGQAIVGDVVEEESDRVLIVFTNIKKVLNDSEPHYSLVRAIWVNKDLLA
jgi:hypothetical protein